jgi:TatA/E family protein of Tat protein translocase
MGSLGMQEIIVIFILALIIFGPRKLPELGKTIGKSLAEFKKASNELKQTWEEEVRLDKEKEAITEIIKDVEKDSSILSTEIASLETMSTEILSTEIASLEITSPETTSSEITKNDNSVGSKEIQ